MVNFVATKKNINDLIQKHEWFNGHRSNDLGIH